MAYIKILSFLITAIEWVIDWRKKHSNSEQVKATAIQQKLTGAQINAINKKERATRNKLDSLDSLRERAKAINGFKNTDV